MLRYVICLIPSTPSSRLHVHPHRNILQWYLDRIPSPKNTVLYSTRLLLPPLIPLSPNEYPALVLIQHPGPRHQSASRTALANSRARGSASPHRDLLAHARIPPFPIDNLSNGQIDGPFPILSHWVNRDAFHRYHLSLYRYACLWWYCRTSLYRYVQYSAIQSICRIACGGWYR